MTNKEKYCTVRTEYFYEQERSFSMDWEIFSILSLADARPTQESSCAAFLVTASDSRNALSILRRGVAEQYCGHLLILGATGQNNGYAGPKVWRQQLQDLQVDPKNIVEVPWTLDGENHNTLTEAVVIARYAKQQGYKMLTTISWPAHQPRAFASMITAALREYPELKVYSAPGSPLSWFEKVVHSQGKQQGTRITLLEEEIKKLRQYEANGSIAPLAKILEYLEKR